jgi:hypothetical protein
MLVLIISGCAPATDDVRILGIITLDGVPLEEGSIMFFEKDVDRSFSTLIHNGKYELNILPGEKIVHITAKRPTGTVPRNEFSGDTVMEMTYESIVPEKYNTKTTLSCVITPKGGKQDFDLLSK